MSDRMDKLDRVTRNAVYDLAGLGFVLQDAEVGTAANQIFDRLETASLTAWAAFQVLERMGITVDPAAFKFHFQALRAELGDAPSGGTGLSGDAPRIGSAHPGAPGGEE